MAYLIVGIAAWIRVSSSTVPSFIGTLKSTRINTRFSLSSTSFTDFFCIPLWLVAPLTLRSDKFDHIADPARVTPLVVVPGEYLYSSTADNLSIFSVDDRRVWVSTKI